MCVQERKLNNMEALQLVKDYTVEHAQGVYRPSQDIFRIWGDVQLLTL